MDLEKLLMESVEKNTPDYIKEDKIFNYNDKNTFTFKLTKETVEKHCALFGKVISYREKEMATHSSILAWKILWTEKPGRLQSVRS